MYTIRALTKGNCDANDGHTGTDVLLLDDLVTRTSLSLCPKCFLQQLRLRCKGRKIDPVEAPNGRDEAATSAP